MNYHEIISIMAYTMKPENYLEVGVNKGYTFNRVAPFVKRMAYAVDIVDIEKNIKHNHKYKFFKMPSKEFIDKLNTKREIVKFDMIFIDAYHDYKTSKMEFTNLFKYLNYNGIMFMHDTHPNKRMINANKCGDVWKTALDIKNIYSDECECLTIPYWKGLTIIRKIQKNKQISWMTCQDQ